MVRAQRLTPKSVPQTLSAPETDTQLADLTSDRSGDAIAAWLPIGTVPQTAPRGVGAAIRLGSTGRFGPPELALADPRATGSAAAAIGPDGQALVAAGSVPGDTTSGVLTSEIPAYPAHR